jgi:hypothetical protein
VPSEIGAVPFYPPRLISKHFLHVENIVLRNFHHTCDIVNNEVAIFKMADRAVRPAGTTAKPQEEGGGKVHSVRNQSTEPY